MKSKHTNDWASLLQAQMADRQKLPPGSGWQTEAEIRKITGIGQGKNRRLLNEGILTGQVEVFRGHRTNETGELVRCVWYRRTCK